MDLKISVVTPMFNNELYIGETIKSVISQSYANWEMIIVDDGSTDNSCKEVEKYVQIDSRIKLYKRDRLPKGVSTSRNIGIDKTKGNYIMFLDADDLLYPHCFKKRIKTVQDNDPLDFIVFQMDALSPLGMVKGRYQTKIYDNYLYAFLAHNIAWSVTCPLWDTRFLKEKVIGFDERLNRLEDPDIHTKALLVENVKYRVYAELEYTDSTYRVDYRSTSNLTPFLDCALIYLQKYLPVVKQRQDSQACLHAMAGFHNNIYSHYTTSSVSEMIKNADRVMILNRFFRKNRLISTKTYWKDKFFIYGIKYHILDKKVSKRILTFMRFSHFYGFWFSN